MFDNNVPKLRFPGFDDAWEQRKLEEMVSFSKGSGYSKGDLKAEGTPIILYGRLYTKYETVITEIDTYVDARKGSVYSNGGEVIVPASGETAEDISIASVVEKPGVLLGGDLNIITPPEDLDSAFLAISISNGKPHNDMAKMAQGKSVVHLHNSDLGKIDLPYPSYDEQRLISGFFSSIDNLITLQQRKCDEIKNLKKCMLQKMFPREGEQFPEYRFPGFTDAWEQRKFSEVFDGLQNNTLSRAELNYDNGSVMNVHYGDVLIKYGDYIDATSADLPFVTDESIVNKFSSSFLQDGDIIIADTAEDETVGKCCEIVNSEGIKLLSGLHTIACRPKQKYAPKFLGYYINSVSYRRQLLPLMQGIKVTSLSKGALQDTDLLVPKSIDEQAKIGEFFSKLDNIITLQQRKFDELKELKKGLLQQMFI